MTKQDRPSDLPATLELYRQEANWIVGLSVAAIAAGTGFADRLAQDTMAARILSTMAGLCFLCSVIAGVFLYARLNEWAGCWLQLADPHEQAARDKVQERMDRARLWVARCYRALISAFPLGVILTASLALVGLWQSRAAVRSTPPTSALVFDDSGRMWQVGHSRDTALRAWRVPMAVDTSHAGRTPQAAAHPPPNATARPARERPSRN
jgi:hypothetical protein